MRLFPFLAAFFVSVFLVACGGSSAELCGPTNCGGCCTAAGICESGELQSACGFGGQTCSACSSAQVCSSKTCVATGAGGGSGGGTGGGAGGGAGGGGGGDGQSDGGAIVAPNEQWTWVPFSDSACGNGSATGIGINPTTRSTDMLIYMQGGGACWNATTCVSFPTAANLGGYGATSFANDSFKNAYAVNRSAAANPFKDMSYVYVPYCTGDVHAGDNIATYGSTSIHHKGRKNVEAFLTRLKVTFPNATRVFVGGSSAGAYGAQINYQRVKAAWPNAQVHVLADCGQMVNPNGTLLNEWKANWGLQSPTGCTACDTDFTEVPKFLASTYATSRFGLLAYTQDDVLRKFFGYTPADFQTQTLALLTSAYDPNPNSKYFVLAGTQHVMLGGLNTISSPGGKTLNSWVTEFVNGSGSWNNIKP